MTQSNNIDKGLTTLVAKKFSNNHTLEAMSCGRHHVVMKKEVATEDLDNRIKKALDGWRDNNGQ